ncbi:helix-turn-helix transcriptional regulator [Heyndrickxia sp. FSL W8-0496]|uniref:helix-turn-helix domain-containing protein n=1 Tax=Heyndrickxia sp. FSL W8-0496 TaxID=2954702 RepID=UPI0030F92079
MEIQREIRNYIESNGIKFNYVAERSGIPIKTFYRIVNGSKKLSLEEFEKICFKGLSVDPSFFLNKSSQNMRKRA